MDRLVYSETVLRRFWAKVNKNGPIPAHAPHLGACWLWTHAKSGAGYGGLRIDKQDRLAHRVAWEILHGAIPPGAHILHHCDNPPCVRPEHLWVGSHAENIADREAKGRGALKKGQATPWPVRRVFGSETSSAKLNEAAVLEIKRRYSRGDITQRALAREYGVDQSVISDIMRGKIWTHVRGG